MRKPAKKYVLLEVAAGGNREQDGIIRTTWYRFDTAHKA